MTFVSLETSYKDIIEYHGCNVIVIMRGMVVPFSFALPETNIMDQTNVMAKTVCIAI